MHDIDLIENEQEASGRSTALRLVPGSKEARQDWNNTNWVGYPSITEAHMVSDEEIRRLKQDGTSTDDNLIGFTYDAGNSNDADANLNKNMARGNDPKPEPRLAKVRACMDSKGM